MFRAGQEARNIRVCRRVRLTAGGNDERTNPNELGFVFWSCSYANVGFFWVRSPMRTTRTR